jgi:hypothetical protein
MTTKQQQAREELYRCLGEGRDLPGEATAYPGAGERPFLGRLITIADLREHAAELLDSLYAEAWREHLQRIIDAQFRPSLDGGERVEHKPTGRKGTTCYVRYGRSMPLLYINVTWDDNRCWSQVAVSELQPLDEPRRDVWR